MFRLRFASRSFLLIASVASIVARGHSAEADFYNAPNVETPREVTQVFARSGERLVTTRITLGKDDFYVGAKNLLPRYELDPRPFKPFRYIVFIYPNAAMAREAGRHTPSTDPLFGYRVLPIIKKNILIYTRRTPRLVRLLTRIAADIQRDDARAELSQSRHAREVVAHGVVVEANQTPSPGAANGARAAVFRSQPIFPAPRVPPGVAPRTPLLRPADGTVSEPGRSV